MHLSILYTGHNSQFEASVTCQSFVLFEQRCHFFPSFGRNYPCHDKCPSWFCAKFAPGKVIDSKMVLRFCAYKFYLQHTLRRCYLLWEIFIKAKIIPIHTGQSELLTNAHNVALSYSSWWQFLPYSQHWTAKMETADKSTKIVRLVLR